VTLDVSTVVIRPKRGDQDQVEKELVRELMRVSNFDDDGNYPINFPMYTEDAKRQVLNEKREHAEWLADNGF